MARTIKVTAEKAGKEWAREAGNKKIALMKKVREANKKKSSEDKGQKKETIVSKEGGEKRKKKKSAKGGCRPSKKYKSIKKGQAY